MSHFEPIFSPGRILLFNLLGALLVWSWLSPSLLFWTELDDAVFFTTNAWLSGDNDAWVLFVAALNTRVFDVASLLVLLALFVWAMSRDPWHPNRLLRWGGIGVAMLLAAVFIAQGVRLAIPYTHPSPTLVYDNVNLVTQLVDLPTKDSSASSFPGDHGINLFLFAAFMWRFAGLRVALVSAAFAVLLSAPRILSGAHWFSDVFFAALAINLIATPWILLTPAGPALARAIGAGLLTLRGALPDRPSLG
ncbi:phosphatase PAP2 family protein [Halomonas sp. MCCC 1A17488]|uniref:Phosphatase PAP2 family protein n=1 Tax=Billgrantia sulfidoxydans TaxID=2733484 RepID=A0ABX7W7S6_9GAMM|nr:MULTISPECIES: phosphatase PAP2 family protein [Halomonas]MCE8017876.1 phosphatase PAP2 family protein [Halomonas sp. MCCC 1A17488]MCG3241209.1 phosphatase PAP2 family protein [Halomonas sp. MCCC 1A17488]QPP49056.1 phosphatase PAP2 family protein [Halomonas sp. SS10-MC5]QTP56391.1 phosphatase PAP2 family protein [Halomonas sulfidoxydans]